MASLNGLTLWYFSEWFTRNSQKIKLKHRIHTTQSILSFRIHDRNRPIYTQSFEIIITNLLLIVKILTSGVKGAAYIVRTGMVTLIIPLSTFLIFDFLVPLMSILFLWENKLGNIWLLYGWNLILDLLLEIFFALFAGQISMSTERTWGKQSTNE